MGVTQFFASALLLVCCEILDLWFLYSVLACLSHELSFVLLIFMIPFLY